MFGVPWEVLALREGRPLPSLISFSVASLRDAPSPLSQRLRADLQLLPRVHVFEDELAAAFNAALIHPSSASSVPRDLLDKLRKSSVVSLSPYPVSTRVALLTLFLTKVPDGLVPHALLTGLRAALVANTDVTGLRAVLSALTPSRQCALHFLLQFAATLPPSSQSACLAWLSRLIFASDAAPNDVSSVDLSSLLCHVDELFAVRYTEDTAPQPRFGLVTKLADIVPAPRVASKRGIRILSLDGGGMRGLFSLAILQSICTGMFGDCGVESTKKFVGYFDLISGTSTGGIIAVSLARGHSLAEIRDTYLSVGRDVFSAPLGFLYSPARYLRYYRSGDFYSGTLLEQLFSSRFGNDAFAALPSKVFVTSTDATNEIWQPVLFRSYANEQSQFDGISDAPIPVALRATSAAPTYFSNVTLSDKLLIDGGCIANNPTEIAIFEAHHLWPSSPIDMVLSIGTGVPAPGAGSVNILRLINEFVDISTNSEIVHQRIKEWISLEQRPIHYARFSPGNGLGSVALDSYDLTVLQDGEKKSMAYMAEAAQVAQIDALKPYFTEN